MNQPKYINKPFDDMLMVSQGFVDEIVEYFKSTNNPTLLIRPQDDQHPFIFSDSTEVRGPDIFISMNGFSAFIEAKDFGKFIKYPCTGLPGSTVKKYRKFKKLFNVPLILLFRDNIEIEKEKNSLFKKDNIYIPYGGEIDSLEINKSLSYNEYFRSKFNGELQEIWNVKSMKSINYIIEYWNLILNNKDIKQLNLL